MNGEDTKKTLDRHRISQNTVTFDTGYCSMNNHINMDTFGGYPYSYLPSMHHSPWITNHRHQERVEVEPNYVNQHNLLEKGFPGDITIFETPEITKPLNQWQCILKYHSCVSNTYPCVWVCVVCVIVCGVCVCFKSPSWDFLTYKFNVL